MYGIYKDLVTPSLAQDLHKILLGNNFPWFFNQCVVDKKAAIESFYQDENTIESNQFTHIFFSEGVIRSNYLQMVMPIVFLLEMRTGKQFSNKMVRIKANLLTKNNSYNDGKYNSPHTDSSNSNGESLLYYANDSDGDTFIFNEKRGKDFKKLTLNERITPEIGKCVFFDSDYYHASSCPRNTDVRVVINFLFNK